MHTRRFGSEKFRVSSRSTAYAWKTSSSSSSAASLPKRSGAERSTFNSDLAIPRPPHRRRATYQISGPPSARCPLLITDLDCDFPADLQSDGLQKASTRLGTRVSLHLFAA